MSEIKCWACLMFFELDVNDDRPFIWHKHPDGTMVANENPNLKKEPRKYHPKQVKHDLQKKLFWQDLWGTKPKKEVDE